MIVSLVYLTHRQKSRASQAGIPTPPITVQAKGPDEEKIKAILERTGYTLDVTTGSVHPFFSSLTLPVLLPWYEKSLLTRATCF